MLLKVSDLETGYKNKQVLFGISLEVAPGEIVGILGHNGAGKSTLLSAIYGLIGIFRGKVEFLGEDITGNTIRANVQKGLVFVAGGHQVFKELSVMENFKIIKNLHKYEDFDSRLEIVFKIFPRMKERRAQIARTLSGGEQQMLAIAIGLLMNPKLLILDEPSLGLAPLLVANIMETIKFINREYNVSILLVEQNIKYALDSSSRIYVMRLGKMLLQSPAEEFKKRESYVDLF